MIKKCVVVFCLLSLIGFVSCKKSKSDGADPATDQLLEDIFGGGSGDGDFLDDDPAGGENCNNNGECDTGETKENCPADCTGPNEKGNPSMVAIDFAAKIGDTTISKTDGHYPLKELEKMAFMAKLENFTGEVTFQNPEITTQTEEGEDCVEIEIDEEDQEKKRADYTLSALSVGTCSVTFSFIDAENPETIFSKEASFKVEKNILENDTEIEATGVVIGITDVVIIKSSSDGSGVENHSWEDTVISRIGEDDEETEVADDGTVYSLDKEDGEEEGEYIETITFHEIGNYKIETTVVDNVLGYSAPFEKAVKVSDEAGVDLYRVSKTFDNGLASEILPENLLTKESKNIIEKGEMIVVVVTGHDDSYSCSIDNSLGTGITAVEKPTVSLEVDDETDLDGLYAVGEGKVVACVLQIDDDAIDQHGLTFEGTTLKVDGDHLPATESKTYSFLFKLNPCDPEAEITIEVISEEIGGEPDAIVGEMIDLNDANSDADYEYRSVELASSYKIQFRVFGGNPGKNGYKLNDSSLTSLVSSTEDTTNKTWEIERIEVTEVGAPINTFYYELSGSFEYHGDLPVPGYRPGEKCQPHMFDNEDGCDNDSGIPVLDDSTIPKELLDINVDDTCAGDIHNITKTLAFELQYPEIESQTLDAMFVQMDVKDVKHTWENNDNYSTDISTRIYIDDIMVAITRQDLADCGDDAVDDSQCEKPKHLESIGEHKPSNFSLKDIDEIELKMHEDEVHSKGWNWLPWAWNSDCEINIITIDFCTDYYCARYYDNIKNATGVAGEGISGEMVNGGNENRYEDLTQYMIDQVGGNITQAIWKRRPSPNYVRKAEVEEDDSDD